MIDTISIHAPARGATHNLYYQKIIFPISIHAPARGATIGHTLHAVSEQFQSTPPRGERPYFSDSRLFAVPFQSTPPRGERHGGQFNSDRTIRHFNPRPREGSDDFDVVGQLDLVISIHAPARGATTCSSSIAGMQRISIQAPARGATAVQHQVQMW